MPTITPTGRFWEPKESGTKLTVSRDRFEFTQAADNSRLSVITEIQGLSTAARTALAPGADLAAFDAKLEAEEWDIRDRLDYYNYTNRTENLTVRDGAWFSPEAIESFSNEHATNVAANSIDGNNNTIWQSFQNGGHFAVYRLRSYPKKITRVRFRYGSAEPARERLNNLTIKAARDISQIDEASNILESGLNISWPTPGGVWVEHTLSTFKSNARYIKLETDDTDDTSQPNALQIREFEVFVATRQINDLF